MINALWITLIGMGLVFVAILLLWGLMALLVKLTEERETPEAAEVPAAIEIEPDAAVPTPDADRKRRAAVAAMAVAMALRPKNGRASAAAGHPAGSVSAWQAVHRAGRLGQQMNASRKKVVR